MAGDWSREEVEATVADYFAMLYAERSGIPYNKTEHRRALARLLSGRTDSAIERKHMNISAVLREIGHPTIDGYKPYGNYQQLLAEVVLDRVATDKNLSGLIHRLASEPVAADPGDIPTIEPPPEADPEVVRMVKERAQAPRRMARPPVDYVALEARNQQLGRKGEELVLRLEDKRLRDAGRRKLAERIEHVAAKTDASGFDIHSFEVDGRDRLIEVKTTSFGKRTPFYVTRNELLCSQSEPERYHVYRLFEFRLRPRCFTLSGQIDRTCRLDATTFEARVG